MFDHQKRRRGKHEFGALLFRHDMPKENKDQQEVVIPKIMKAIVMNAIKAVYITLKVDVIHQANKGAKYQQQGKDGEKQS